MCFYTFAIYLFIRIVKLLRVEELSKGQKGDLCLIKGGF